MIRMHISEHEIGVYSLYCALNTVLIVIMNALSNSWVPLYYEEIKIENWKELNKKCKNVFEVFTLICIGFLLLSREVSFFIAPKEFWGGVNVIPILVISAFFMFLYQFPVSYEFYYKKTKVVAIATAISAVVNIVLNFFTIPRLGMIGAAITTAVSYLVLFIIHFIFVQKMTNGLYHLKTKYILPWFIIVIFGGVLFYVMAKFIFIRWCSALLFGVFELYRIIKRKTIF